MRKIIIVLSLVMAVVLMSCGEKNSQVSSNNDAIEQGDEFLNLAEGDIMPNVIVETNKDKTFVLNDTDKPVLINFWATWCPPCRKEMPGLQNLYEKYGDKIDFVMINLGENKETIQDFLIENETYTFPIGYDENEELGMKFDITAIPTTYIVGKDKKIRNYVLGAREESQFDEYLKNAIED